MSTSKLQATIRHASPLIKIIDIEGEIDSFSEPELTEAYAQATQDKTRTIIFNFSKMTYLNSIGIGMLVVLLVRAQRDGKKLGGYGLSEHYQKIFELTRLNHVIPIFQSETVAIANLEPYDLIERES